MPHSQTTEGMDVERDAAGHQTLVWWDGVGHALIAKLVAFIHLSAILEAEDVVKIDLPRKRGKPSRVKPLFWCQAGGAIDVLIVVPIDPLPELEVSLLQVHPGRQLADEPFLEEPE